MGQSRPAGCRDNFEAEPMPHPSLPHQKQREERPASGFCCSLVAFTRQSDVAIPPLGSSLPMGRQAPDLVLLEDPDVTPQGEFDRMRSSRREGVVLYDPVSSGSAKGVAILAPLPVRNATHHQTRPTTRHSRYTDGVSVSSGGRTAINGAICPGGPVDLMNRENIGLLVDFFIAGVVDGTVRTLVYPLFKIYFHLASYQQQTASALFAFGWSLKFIFGFLSDAMPIKGQRRKPYAMVALVIIFAFSTGMMMMPKIEPSMKPKGVVYNAHAPDQSQRYVVLAMIGSLGHALLSVACEGLMVEYAHRENEYSRGRIQGAAYGARYIGSVLAALTVALGCNSEEFGGDFSFSLPLSAILGFLAVVSAGGMYATIYHMRDEKMVVGRQPMYSHLRSIGGFAERRATWQITIVGFVQSFVFLYNIPQVDTIYEQWLHGDTLARGLSYTLSCAMFMLAIYTLRSDRLRNSSWRRTFVVTTAVGSAVGVVSAILLTENIFRNKLFNMLASQVVNFCDTFSWMIGVLVVVEIAEPGYEASSYALITTIYNLAVPLSTAASNIVSSLLSIDDDAIIRDTRSVRRRVLGHYMVMYSLRLIVGIAAIAFLPRQKLAVRQLMMRGNPNATVPFVVMITFTVLFLGTWTIVVLSMFRSTACLSIVGGTGC